MTPPDPLTLLRARHAHLRLVTAGLERIAALPDFGDPALPAIAAEARRYFSEGLPLVLADEDLSLAPRLRAAFPETAPLLAQLEREHQEIRATLATLLLLLDTLAQGRAAPRALLHVTATFLSGLLLPHIAREEGELFPFCAWLPVEDLLAIGEELAHAPS